MQLARQPTGRTLQAAKGRGVRLGNPKLAQAREVVNTRKRAEADRAASEDASDREHPAGRRHVLARDRRRA
jgi:hypothetical protein